MYGFWVPFCFIQFYYTNIDQNRLHVKSCRDWHSKPELIPFTYECVRYALLMYCSFLKLYPGRSCLGPDQRRWTLLRIDGESQPGWALGFPKFVTTNRPKFSVFNVKRRNAPRLCWAEIQTGCTRRTGLVAVWYSLGISEAICQHAELRRHKSVRRNSTKIVWSNRWRVYCV